MSNSVGPNRPLPAATSVTAGSAAVRSIEPVPPPLTKRSGATERTASTISAAPARQLARGQRLHDRAARAAAAACPAGGRRRRRSGPRRPSARRARPRAGRRSRVQDPAPGRDRAAASAWRRSCIRPPSVRQPASTSRQTLTGPPAARGLDRVQVLAAVDHHRDPLARRTCAPAHAARRGRPWGRRRRDRRPRARASQSASGSVKQSVPAKPAANARSCRARTRRDFDASRNGTPPARRSRSASVDVEGVEIDHRKGRIEAWVADIERALEWCLEEVHPNRGGYPLRRSATVPAGTRDITPNRAGQRPLRGRGNQGLEQGSLLRGRIAALCGVARRFPREPDS